MLHSRDRSHKTKMRIPFPCPDCKEYMENPKKFLPEKVYCLRNPQHQTAFHGTWTRNLLIDHVHQLLISLYRWYCKECRESISCWPEFVMPYQPEPIETHERVVVAHLGGQPQAELARSLGYHPQTIGRWTNRILDQAGFLAPRVIPMLLNIIAVPFTPLCTGSALDVLQHILAWLYWYARQVSFWSRKRLMGLANLVQQGRWILWGGEIGRCRYGREIIATPPA